MPLDEFQKAVTILLAANRDWASPFAGGAVIQQHGLRLSGDQDIFIDDGDDALDRIVARDVEALRAGGYDIQPGKTYDGFREAIVTRPEAGRTVLHWTRGLGREFWRPVPDETFGFRLHFTDLAVNKALAAAGRMVMRDFIDLWMLDRHVMPLWRLACAAPGKDDRFSPQSLLEAVSRNWSFARDDDSTPPSPMIVDVSLEAIGVDLRASIREAHILFRNTGALSTREHYGRLQVNAEGAPIASRSPVSGGRWIAPKPGGGMPSWQGVDSEMIAGHC